MINSLSYIGFESPNPEAWRSFGPDILGLEVASAPDEITVRLRSDDATWRIAIHKGDANELAYLGWDVGDDAGLRETVSKLNQAGIETHDGDDVLQESRAVRKLVWFIDPFGFRNELSYGLASGTKPFRAGHHISKFVTGEQGFGHVALIVPDLETATTFYNKVLGFRHSDDIEAGIHLRFFHCNPRHHTIAVAAMPGMRGIHHLMIEVENMDDVGLAYDRVMKAKVPLAMTLGRHPNDGMTSFYVRTPSGFEIEFGCGGKRINMEEHPPIETYDAMSIWGHKHPPLSRRE